LSIKLAVVQKIVATVLKQQGTIHFGWREWFDVS
jgi:hypothetical protein